MVWSVLSSVWEGRLGFDCVQTVSLTVCVCVCVRAYAPGVCMCVCVCDSSYCTGVLISVIGTVVCGAKLNTDDLTVI